MADINVERKQPSVWPWVIGLVVLALLIWVGVEMFRGDAGDGTTVIDSDTTAVSTPAPAPGAAADTMGIIPDTALP